MFIPKKFLNLNLFLLALFTLSLVNPSHAIKLQKGLDDIKIVSANKLNYKNNKTVLTGDVIIKVRDIYISSPNVEIEEKKKAEFTGSVNINSDDLNVVAERMEIDIQTSYITIYNAKSKIKDYQIDSDIQILNLEKGTFRAEAIGDSQVETTHEDMNVKSQILEALFDGDNENIENLNQIKFEKNVLAEKDKSQIIGDKLIVFPQIKQYRVIGNGMFINKAEKLLVEAEFMNVEELNSLEKDYTLIAMSNKKDEKVKIVSEKRKLLANSQLARLWLKDNEVEKLVFTGDSDVRVKDKKLVGDEIVLNNESKELISNLNRPKVILLK